MLMAELEHVEWNGILRRGAYIQHTAWALGYRVLYGEMIGYEDFAASFIEMVTARAETGQLVRACLSISPLYLSS